MKSCAAPFFVVLAVLVALGATSCTTAGVPGSVLADEYYSLGNEWFDLKKYDKAARAYQNALTWNANLKIASVNLARTKAELGDAAGALEILKPLVVADPDNLVVLQYQAWLTAQATGAASAADLYVALAQRLPGDPPTLYNAGVALHAAERDDDALETLQAWKKLDGKGWSGLSLLAELLDKNDAAGAAEAWLSAADSFGESDAKRFLPLARRARALARAQLYGDAVDAWTAALALPSAADQARGEALFARGELLLLKIEDYQAGSQSVLDAWKAGYKDAEAWKALRSNPDLKFGVRLEADLKVAGVAQ